MVNDLERVSVLWEIEQIKQLKARYFRLLDTKQWDQWQDLFTESCRIYCLPDPDQYLDGSDAFATFAQDVLAAGTSVHFGHMPEITILSPTEATGIWSMFDYIDADPSDGEPLQFRGYGHYHEEYVKGVDHSWRIASMRLTRLRVDDSGS